MNKRKYSYKDSAKQVKFFNKKSKETDRTKFFGQNLETNKEVKVDEKSIIKVNIIFCNVFKKVEFFKSNLEKNRKSRT